MDKYMDKHNDAGQIARHISYAGDYLRMVTFLAWRGHQDPGRAIKQWNDRVFGGAARQIYNKRIGLY